MTEIIILDALNGVRGEDQQRIAEVCLEWTVLLLKKNSDYGSSVWKRPILAPECDAGTAIRVRMSDKINRLESLLSKGSAEIDSESIDDTLRDLGAYCLLELARPEQINASQVPATSLSKPEPIVKSPPVATTGFRREHVNNLSDDGF